MTGDKKLRPNDHVIYVDEQRVAHNALIEVWHVGTGQPKLAETLGDFRQQLTGNEHVKDPNSCVPCVNLVFVMADKTRTDQYGYQKSHRSSCIHGDSQTPPRIGNYWLWPEEFDGVVGEYYNLPKT